MARRASSRHGEPTTFGSSSSAVDPTVARPTYVDGEFVPSRDVPFSTELDELIAEIRAGNAPNLGRFCGYCCAPLGAEQPGQTQHCGICDVSTAQTPTVDKIDRDLAQIYVAKRKREGLYVHAAAWTGILLATGLSILMILLLPGWTKAFAIAFLVLGGYFMGVFFGNVLVQGFAYRAGLRMFAKRWTEWLTGVERAA